MLCTYKALRGVALVLPRTQQQAVRHYAKATKSKFPQNGASSKLSKLKPSFSDPAPSNTKSETTELTTTEQHKAEKKSADKSDTAEAVFIPTEDLPYGTSRFSHLKPKPTQVYHKSINTDTNNLPTKPHSAPQHPSKLHGGKPLLKGVKHRYSFNSPPSFSPNHKHNTQPPAFNPPQEQIIQQPEQNLPPTPPPAFQPTPPPAFQPTPPSAPPPPSAQVPPPSPSPLPTYPDVAQFSQQVFQLSQQVFQLSQQVFQLSQQLIASKQAPRSHLQAPDTKPQQTPDPSQFSQQQDDTQQSLHRWSNTIK